MLQVSVPCPGCETELGLQHAACPSCEAPVSRELRDALENRLEAADSEYLEAKHGVERARSALLVIGLLYVAFGLGFYLVESMGESFPTGDGGAEPWLAVAENAGIGLALVGCFAAGRRRPLAALAVASSLWAAVQIAVVLANPGALLLAFLSVGSLFVLVVKVVVAAILMRGVLSALRLRSIVARLERSAG